MIYNYIYYNDINDYFMLNNLHFQNVLKNPLNIQSHSTVSK